MTPKHRIVLLLILLISYSSYAQDTKQLPATLTKANTGFVFDKVFETPNITKDELYKRIKQWVITNVKSAESNSFDETDKNTISTELTFFLLKNNAANNPIIDFKVSIYLEDGKYRINANQFILKDLNTSTPFNNLNKMYIKKTQDVEYADFDKKFTDILASIHSAAEKKDASGNR